MKRPIPKSTLLRFPLLFGGFILAAGAGLFYKDSWMGDIERTRNEIFKEDETGRMLLDDLKASQKSIFK